MTATEFECSVCGKKFSVPQAALEKYPGWKPRYCRDHSPRKKKAAQAEEKAGKTERHSSGSAELNLTLQEVTERYHDGPQSGIFTDGSARPNPGPGGWGAVYVRDGKVVEQKHGKEEHTTNNRMELTALIQAYQMADENEALEVYADSELCVNILTKWAPAWERRGWKRKDGAIKNLDLVKELYALYKSRPKFVLKWIEAHNGWLWNEYADSLASAWAREEL
jgi:ribonuclease HI